jgi:hypothetical protein
MNQTKKCLCCGIEKSLDAFYAYKRGRFGRVGRCKDCWNSQAREKWKLNKRIPKGRVDGSERKQTRFRIYGVTPEQFDEKLRNQDGKCAICGSRIFDEPSTPRVDRACLDHNHLTLSFRGALCVFCNAGLGSFRDSPARLRAAAEYIESNT